jgi:hypothetical protein
MDVWGGLMFFIKPKQYEYNNWLIIIPEDVDLEKFLYIIDKSKFNDMTYPILILEKCKLPISFLRLQDGSIRRYYLSPEVHKFIDPPMVRKTQNSKYYPPHYKHNSFFRVLRMAKKRNKNYLLHDENGHIYGVGYETIPYHRVVFFDEILKQLSSLRNYYE